MKLQDRRTHLTDRASLGELWIDDRPRVFLLEDTVRDPGIKIPGQTAIPEGNYRVVIAMSRRYRRLMPYLMDVPNHKGIMFHWGNTPDDTAGCLLTGKRRDIVNERVLDSRIAFDSFYRDLERACARGSVYCEVTNRFVESDMRNSKVVH